MKKRLAARNECGLLVYRGHGDLFKPVKPWVLCKWNGRNRRFYRPPRKCGVVLLHKTSITFDQRCASQYGTRSRNLITGNVKLRENPRSCVISIKNEPAELGNKLKGPAVNNKISNLINTKAVSYTHLTLPTNREV
eukprot:TRINITY_DN17437_c0_g1_i1.p1 TRINITY_DN17437_c0_g1~~TRINITY_DN17437_c0_g1_i1.p1  ORF type:complete len:136 (+),score=6.97 TRINITY_DN17437_c0_g1_i1:150-557(+)